VLAFAPAPVLISSFAFNFHLRPSTLDLVSNVTRGSVAVKLSGLKAEYVARGMPSFDVYEQLPRIFGMARCETMKLSGIFNLQSS